MRNQFLLSSLLVLTISLPIENSFGLIIKGEPSGSTALPHGELFEVGIKMKKGESIRYSLGSDSVLLFDIHFHHGTLVYTYVVNESKVFGGVFVAPEDGDYYITAENLGDSNAGLKYRISLEEETYTLQYEETRYDVTTSSNSSIEILKFEPEDKELLVRVETPWLTPGFLSITIPKTLLDGPFNVQGGLTDYTHTQDDSSSTFRINTPAGTNDISIIGTTAVPEVPFPVLLLAFTVATFLLIARFGLKDRLS